MQVALADFDSGAPAIPRGINALIGLGAKRTLFAVLRVLKGSAYAQIGLAIIQAVTITVIDHLPRKRARQPAMHGFLSNSTATIGAVRNTPYSIIPAALRLIANPPGIAGDIANIVRIDDSINAALKENSKAAVLKFARRRTTC